MIVRLGAVGLVAGLALVGCSTKYEDRPSPPVPVAYNIEFNSQATAIWLENVVISVVTLDEKTYPDDASRAAACRDLLNRRRTGQSFEPDYKVAAQSAEVTPCELADAKSAAGRFEAPLGPAAIVVVGKNRETPGVVDVQIGCGWGEIDDQADPIRVVLEPFSQFVPSPKPAPANCPRLVDKCANGGRCP